MKEVVEGTCTSKQCEGTRNSSAKHDPKEWDHSSNLILRGNLLLTGTGLSAGGA